MSAVTEEDLSENKVSPRLRHSMLLSQQNFKKAASFEMNMRAQISPIASTSNVAIPEMQTN